MFLPACSAVYPDSGFYSQWLVGCQFPSRQWWRHVFWWMSATPGRDISCRGNGGKDTRIPNTCSILTRLIQQQKNNHIFTWQNTSVSLNTTEVAPMMSPELPAVPSTTQSPDSLSGSPTQAMCPELEEAWMELLSLPELQVWGRFNGVAQSIQEELCKECTGDRTWLLGTIACLLVSWEEEAGAAGVALWLLNHCLGIMQRFCRLYEKKALRHWMHF